jgi:hypothetical protein
MILAAKSDKKIKAYGRDSVHHRFLPGSVHEYLGLLELSSCQRHSKGIKVFHQWLNLRSSNLKIFSYASILTSILAMHDVASSSFAVS